MYHTCHLISCALNTEPNSSDETRSDEMVYAPRTISIVDADLRPRNVNCHHRDDVG